MTNSTNATNASERVAPEQAESMRLQKYLSRCGVASRRASETLITQGRVSINGQLVSELGAKVLVGVDVVCLDGKQLHLQAQDVTLMLNKPAGYVTTMSDPQGRACVASLIPIDEYPSLFPVGRLDRDTTGLLLFSTDGQLGNKLLHPRHHVEKTYLAYVQGVPSEDALDRLREGIRLNDGPTQPAKVQLLQGEPYTAALQAFDFGEKGSSGRSNAARKLLRKSGKKMPSAILSITIKEGRNRQVRRMCEAIGHTVIALHRCQFGPLSLAGLGRGAWRILSDDELTALLRCAERGE